MSLGGSKRAKGVPSSGSSVGLIPLCRWCNEKDEGAVFVLHFGVSREDYGG